jgi:hypothetical protein
MWIVKRDVGIFSAICIRNENVHGRPIGNKETKNQPTGDKDKRVLPFIIYIHDRSGKFKWLWY